MSELQKRRLERVELTETVHVFDVNHAIMLGSLVNIHEEGLLIVGDNAIKPDHVYQIELQIPGAVAGDAISLGVDCLWVKAAEDTTMQWAGCHIIDLSSDSRAKIAQLIEALGR